MMIRKKTCFLFPGLLLIALCIGSLPVKAQTSADAPSVSFYGNPQNDLYRLLQREGFRVRLYPTPDAAVGAAPDNSGVFIVGARYPAVDLVNKISASLMNKAAKKHLRLYIEYPAAFPGLDIPSAPLETHLERGVVTSSVLGLPQLSLLGIHNSYVLPVKAADPMLVLAKVVGVDRAELGLDSTPSYPLLFEKQGALLAMTGLSNFQTGRYGPDASVRTLWRYLISRIAGQDVRLDHWVEDVKPSYGRNETLPAGAVRSSIQKGVQWFYQGRFFIDPSWKADWIKYGSNGLKPVGPPLGQNKRNGNGSLGVLEGHTSTIYYNGTQQYRYWIRADVQGEVSMALAAAGKFLGDTAWQGQSARLLDFLFNRSNLRAGHKNDPQSAVFGLIGWASTNAGTFYGDDNSRAILGAIGASAYLKNDRWNKVLAEAIMGNFRTTGKEGFRGDRLEEADILKNGWPYYFNRDIKNPSPHFESWMWALYLWLYDKTGYKPLLERTEKAIRITMADYPDKWLWGSSLQTQRARMILPLAWLVRVSNTPEHRQWLDRMVKELLSYQDASGAIREEMGKGKGMFRELKKNSDYGSDEGSLITHNGQQIACMLYTNNFALFSLHEAAMATGDPSYMQAVEKLSGFLTRIQISSTKHPDLDGGWFRAFDYGKWDYWASNSDAGWGAWCTLTGWIQSWILTSQIEISKQESYWDITRGLKMGPTAREVIRRMMTPPATAGR
ncbi:hypothetical protein [Compostibacter hankyongensis]|uniref:Alpha-L-rhamnosidase six-hairpin glycosidase domain-containing protein n=1 Tax=Compostibacter hankyongensis TaxID=1007089 RepID=A0ABP8G2Z6_9BACT